MGPQNHPALHASVEDILALIGDGIISADENGRILLFNGAAEKIFGYDAKQVLGQPVETLLPERMRSIHAVQLREFARGNETAGRTMGHRREVVGRRRNGEEFPVEATLSKRSLDGRAILMVVVRDISERMRLQEQIEARTRALDRSEHRLHLALEGGRMGSWEWDLGSDALGMDETARRLWGFAETSELDVQAALERIHPDDLPGVREAIRQATEDGVDYNHEFRIICPDRRKAWICGRAIVLRDRTGMPERMIGVTFDVTDRQESEEQRRLVSAELGHRIKNMMTLVSSIVSMTARNVGSVDEFRDALQGRLSAISEAHTALFRTGWSSVALEEQLEAELKPYRGSRETNIVLDGPEVALPAQLALTLRMAAHELATNAAKYGALGSPGGRVEIIWRVDEGGSAPMLVLQWRETGGPPVSPPDRKGFGTTLITRSLARHRGARVEFDFCRKGLICKMFLPLEAPRQSRRALSPSG